jgi:signal transduction histidine kinase
MMAVSDITDKKLMELEILNRNVQEQKKITRAVLRAQEKERNKIGQELHDNINQILAGAKMYLGLTLNNKSGSHELLQQSSNLIDNAINEIRSLTQEQVTPRLQIDLKTLIQVLVDNFNRQNKFKATFEYNFDILDINNDLKLNIYRIIQEGTNNIIKHAGAKNVNILLEKVDPDIHIVLTDDGKGFSADVKSNGIGLANIRNRVESFNGKVSFQSSPGKGCKLDAYIPFSPS